MNDSEVPDVGIAHLLLALLANAELLRIEVLDRDIIDRQEIVNRADLIEKHAYELAHLVLGANIDEWKAEQQRKRENA